MIILLDESKAISKIKGQTKNGGREGGLAATSQRVSLSSRNELKNKTTKPIQKWANIYQWKIHGKDLKTTLKHIKRHTTSPIIKEN